MVEIKAEPEGLNQVQPDIADSRRLIVLESLTLLPLVGLTLWCVGPLTEEWGLLRAFNAHGLGYIQSFAHTIPLRPLHLVAYALQWLLGNGLPIGVAVGTSVVSVTRYFVARWAVSPLLFGYDRWASATMAAVLALWPGVWLGRYGSAQLSAVLFFATLGFAIRLFHRWSTTWAVGCAGCVVLLLAMYQGLALCLIAIPFAAFLWGRSGDPETAKKHSKGIEALRICLVVATGFALYGIYCLVISAKLGNGGYEGILASESGRLFTARGLWAHVETAFLTAFGQQAHLLPLFLLTACFLCAGGLGGSPTIKSRLSASALAFLLVTSLPILSLIYVSGAHIRDIDRVLFPVCTGFVLVCISLLSRFRSQYSAHGKSFYASVTVMVLLVASALAALSTRQNVELQRSVLSQTFVVAERRNAKSVVIRDATGTLGDVNTLFEPLLNDAIAVLGRTLTATICTPLSVDRLHPVAQRFPIPTTTRCEELPPPGDGSVVLTARWENGRLVVEP